MLMYRRLPCSFLLAACATVGLAQPIVNAVENNYSYIPAGLPNYGIAQGSIFVIFGSNLAAAPSGLQGLPLKTSISGVSVQFAVQGATTQALLYYVMPNQIAGVLPSATPAGMGTVVVTSNGQSSAPAPITVVESAIGLLTGNGSGSGPAAAFDASWQPLGPTNAANPGDVVVLFGSGAGPVTGDESIQQVPQNLSNVPIEVDIGGKPATVEYHGRSIYPGLDQINVVIPSGVVASGTIGCNISVTARSGNLVSNFAFIPVAANSRGCTDQVPGVTLGPSILLTGKSSYNIGTLTLKKNVVSNPGHTSDGPDLILTSVTGSGQFMQIDSAQPGTPVSTQVGQTSLFPSIGSCEVVDYTIRTLTETPAPAAATTQLNLLNAGPVLNFSGPNGAASVMFQAFQPGIYAGTLGANGSGALPFIPDAGGLFTIDNGRGGPDIGAFRTQINVPPPLVWSNMDGIALVDRTQPLTITWTGGDPGGIVSLEGNSSVTTATQVIAAQFNCSAPVAVGQFTIPPSVLLALPPQGLLQGTGSNYVPTLQVTGETNYLFTAPGLDGGLISTASVNNLTVAFQ